MLRTVYLALVFMLSWQANADCSDDAPPDYELSVGGPPTNQVTGGSDISVSESSVVLDRLPHLYHEPESHTLEVGPRIASSKYPQKKKKNEYLNIYFFTMPEKSSITCSTHWSNQDLIVLGGGASCTVCVPDWLPLHYRLSFPYKRTQAE